MKTMLCAALILTAAACAAADDPMTAGDEVEEIAAPTADRAVTLLPLGTFDVVKPQLGEIRELTLNADHSFARWIQVIDCPPLRGCAPETGSFKFTRSTTTGAHYLRFYDADGVLMDRYQYTFDGTALALRPDDASASWSAFTAH